MSNNPVATHITKNNVTTDLHDRRLPSSLGTSDQVLKMNAAGTAIEWGDAGKVDDIKVGEQSIVVNKVATLSNDNLPSRTVSKISDLTATAAELNVLDGITATTTELNYVDGVTSNIQTQLNNKETADNTILKQANIVDTTSSTSTTQPLSANMGKELQDQVNNLKNIGRFLSIWNANTGAPTSEPTVTTYEYKVGDYYRIGTEGTKNPAPNSTYTVGGTNWIEGGSLKIGDVLYISNISGTTATWVKQEASGGGKIQDVQVNGTTIVDSGSGIANLTGTNLPSHTLSKISDVTASAAEINVLDGITATTTELNYTDGVTGNIQTQLDGKQPTISSSSKLSADLIDDSGATNKFVTEAQKTAWTNKQDALPSTSSHEGEFLHANEDTGVLEWDAPEKGEYASFDTNKLHFTEEPVEPAKTQKTITGLFPLTWQDGIGGDLVDYSLNGSTAYSGSKNQLLVNGNFSNESMWSKDIGVSYTVSNNVATIVNTVDDAAIYKRITIDESHVFYNCISAKTNYGGTIQIADIRVDCIPDGEWHLYDIVAESNSLAIGTHFNAGTSYAKNAMFVDLTALVGAGNEPTTTAEAKQLIANVMNHGTPLDYYPYDSGTPYAIGVGDYGGKKNQLVQNGNFESASGWSTSGYGTISANNNILTFVLSVASGSARIQKSIQTISGHKYLISYDIKPNKNTVAGVFACGGWGTNISVSANTKTNYACILTSTGSDDEFGLYCNGNAELSVGDIVEYSNAQLFDLTALFPNETITDVAEAKARIAEVMNNGVPKAYYDYDAGTDYYTIPIKVVDNADYEQKHTAYRNSQLTAGQTISMLQDNLPHFTSLPTGYLQMGVDTEVQPSGGSVTYLTGTVTNYDLTQVKFSDDTTKNIADHRLPSTLGTANQVLKMNSAGTAIEWGSGGSGGGDVADVKVNGTSVVDANKVAQVTVPVFVETTLDDYLENEATYSLTNNIYFVGGSELTDVSTEAR